MRLFFKMPVHEMDGKNQRSESSQVIYTSLYDVSMPIKRIICSEHMLHMSYMSCHGILCSPVFYQYFEL